MRRLGGLALATIAFAACSPQAPAQNANDSAPIENNAAAAVPTDGVPQTGLRQVPLTIRSATGKHAFTVQVAATPEEQERGLMFTRTLAPDRGMIFPYEPPRDIAFWMKNTLIPLDMIFIRTDGTIARIYTAQPLDMTPVPSLEPVAAVLEIAGSRAAELGIREGDRVEWTR
ncbi:MAG TPA: DUF192 domain-containing protein [Sphingomicrobium sp.]